MARAEQTPAGGTTHVSAVDADGNAASLSSSTGSGSGVIVPGTGIQLNNMLGEYDLVAGAPAESGHRLTSMMAPTVVLADGRPRLVVGSAGSVRLRGAIMQVIVNVLVHGDGVAAAIDAPRVHVEDSHVHCEGGFDPAELDRVEVWSKNLVRWRRPNLYFGGTNAVEVLPDGSLAAAGDAAPRRRRRRRRMSDEVPLGGGWSTGGVVRVGDTVRRPSEHASQLMRDVLVAPRARRVRRSAALARARRPGARRPDVPRG